MEKPWYKKWWGILFILFVVVSLANIVLQQSIRVNQEKFENLYHSAKAIEGAIDVGVNYQKFGELLQKFSTEISIVSEKAKSLSVDERELLTIYSEVLYMYQDSYRLWRSKIELSCESFYPAPCPLLKNHIHIGEEAAKVYQEKYNLSLFENPNVTGLFNRYYIPEDSIQIIWAKAHEKLEKASNLYLGK